MTLPRLNLGFASVLTLLCACNRGGSDAMNFRHNKENKGTPVAKFGDDSITAEELKQRFAEMSPFIRARYQTPEQRREYVDGLARFELLVAEARRRGLQNEPEVVDAAKKQMVQKLIQKEFDEKRSPIPDSEIADYYEKHKSDYVKPESTRLTAIFFSASKEDGALRSKKKALAEEVLGKAKSKPASDSASFTALVREHSEDSKTKALDGDMRFLSEAELSSQYTPEVAAAAATLNKLGDLSPVVETALGFYLLRFQGRQAALNHSLDQVKTQIQNRIQFDRRTQNFNHFVDELKSKAKYSLNEEALAKVPIDTSLPASNPSSASSQPARAVGPPSAPPMANPAGAGKPSGPAPSTPQSTAK